MALFSGAEKWTLCFLSSGSCFFLVFSESHSFPVSPRSPNLSHSNPCTIRDSYTCFCLSPTTSLPASPMAYTDTLSSWSHAFTQRLGQGAHGQWLLFQPGLSKEPGHLPGSSCSSASPGLPSPPLPSRSLEQLFPPNSVSWNSVHIPSH